MQSKTQSRNSNLDSLVIPRSLALGATFLATYLALNGEPKSTEMPDEPTKIESGFSLPSLDSATKFFSELYVKEAEKSNITPEKFHEPKVSEDGYYIGDLDFDETELLHFKYDPELDDIVEIQDAIPEVPTIQMPLTKNDRPAVRKALTITCFDDSYRTKEDCNSAFFNRGLKELLDARVFPKGSLVAYALGNDGKIDPAKGMRLLWRDKIKANLKRDRKREKSERQLILDHAHRMTKYETAEDTPGSLQGFAKDIDYSLTSVENIDLERLVNVRGRDLDDDAKAEVKKFMKHVFSRMNSNIMLAYAMTEIMPRNMDVIENGEEVNKNINGVGKAYLLDAYLALGEKFVANYPAIWDGVYSYGPFQFTLPAIDTAETLIRYVEDDFKVPEFEDFDSLQDHANAAVLFAYSNWLGLGINLADKGLIKGMNEMFEGSDRYASRAFVAGLTGDLHHLPGKTRKYVRRFVRNNDSLDVAKMRKTIKGDLRGYFDATARSYMAMEVYRFENFSSSMH